VRARLERKIGVTLGSEGRFDAALDAYATAEQLLNHDPVHDRAWWEEWLEAGIEDMWIHYQAADWREMERQAQRLQQAAEQYGSAAQQVGVQRTLGAMLARRDRYVIGHDALRHSRAALAIAEEAGDEVLQGSCWFSLGFALLWHGSVDQAEEALLRALELCGRTRDVTTETACWVYLAVAARLRGDVPLTRERATAGLRAATATGSRPYTAAARANLAWVAIREHADEDAARLAGEALETWEFSPVVHAFHWQATWRLL
jgi:tetratricopeptide (TPR) repeat protein